jgi:hypothetical protein
MHVERDRSVHTLPQWWIRHYHVPSDSILGPTIFLLSGYVIGQAVHRCSGTLEYEVLNSPNREITHDPMISPMH